MWFQAALLKPLLQSCSSHMLVLMLIWCSMNIILGFSGENNISYCFTQKMILKNVDHRTTSVPIDSTGMFVRLSSFLEMSSFVFSEEKHPGLKCLFIFEWKNEIKQVFSPWLSCCQTAFSSSRSITSTSRSQQCSSGFCVSTWSSTNSATA